jgi:hypothetical protein
MIPGSRPARRLERPRGPTYPLPLHTREAIAAEVRHVRGIVTQRAGGLR